VNTFDLIVVGAGIVGAACADLAAAQGLRIAIVEPGPIGGGATAASMGHLVVMDDDPAELALSRYSLQLWEEYADLPEAEFSRCGTLWIARDERERAGIGAKIARLAQAGVRAQAIDIGTLYELEPELAPGLAGGMLVAGEAVVYPPRVADFLIKRAVSHRADLFQSRRVQRLVDDGVVLDDGTRLSGRVLVATGCALPDLLPMLPMRARKGHLVITDRYPAFVHHQLLELGYADSAHGDAPISVAFNVQPRPTGQVLVGSSREFETTRDISMPTLRRMLDRAFSFLPRLRDLRALRIWTGFRPTTPDGRPYLGPVPGLRDVWVAAGHEGLGVTTAFGSARLVVDQLLGNRTAIDSAPYLPARSIA